MGSHNVHLFRVFSLIQSNYPDSLFFLSVDVMQIRCGVPCRVLARVAAVPIKSLLGAVMACLLLG